MPARGTASNRGTAANRGTAVGRGTASGRQSVSAAADDMTFLEEIIVPGGGSASVTFSGISSAYRQLMLYWMARGTTAGSKTLRIQFNGDTGANYSMESMQGFDVTVAAGEENAVVSSKIGNVNGSDAPANTISVGVTDIPFYAATTFAKNSLGNDGRVTSASTSTVGAQRGTWNSTVAITSITLFPDAGNFAESSRFTLYGIT